MYVPASDQRKVAKTTTLSVDSLVFDIEDGVALNQKVNEMIVAVVLEHSENMRLLLFK